jgi:hypothetical protein
MFKSAFSCCIITFNSPEGELVRLYEGALFNLFVHQEAYLILSIIKFWNDMGFEQSPEELVADIISLGVLAKRGFGKRCSVEI